jgi:hypothetical protein
VRRLSSFFIVGNSSFEIAIVYRKRAKLDTWVAVTYTLNPKSLVNTPTGFALEIYLIAGPQKREARALANRKQTI